MRLLSAMFGAMILSHPATVASQQGASDAEADRSTYAKIWELAEWYSNEENPYVQSVLFSGRYQHDLANVDADQGSHDEWNVRRLRVGVRSRLFRAITLHGEVELNPQEADPLLVRLTDTYLQWSPTGELALTVGKHGVPFTVDGATSSKELLAIDRGSLSNNLWFPQEYIPGVSVSGEASRWVYRAGAFSAGSANRWFGDFNGSVFGLVSAGYDFASGLGVNEAVLTGSYVHQPADSVNTFTRPLEHVVSANLKVDADRWGLRTDAAGGVGYLGQSDLWGAMAMPFLNWTDRLQLVGRYTLVKSVDPNGVSLPTYENRVASGRGDRYDELYLGANYYFYGHKLKVQGGVQLGEMDDRASDGGGYSGLSWTAGFRASW